MTQKWYHLNNSTAKQSPAKPSAEEEKLKRREAALTDKKNKRLEQVRQAKWVPLSPERSEAMEKDIKAIQ